MIIWERQVKENIAGTEREQRMQAERMRSAAGEGGLFGGEASIPACHQLVGCPGGSGAKGGKGKQ